MRGPPRLRLGRHIRTSTGDSFRHREAWIRYPPPEGRSHPPMPFLPSVRTADRGEPLPESDGGGFARPRPGLAARPGCDDLG
jgi:hypothetical protein